MPPLRHPRHRTLAPPWTRPGVYSMHIAILQRAEQLIRPPVHGEVSTTFYDVLSHLSGLRHHRCPFPPSTSPCAHPTAAARGVGL